MNDQELEAKIYDLFATDKSLIEIVDSTMEFIKQDQAIREIDSRIEEIKYLSRGDVVYIDIGEREVEERIAELQSKKDKLIKGVE